MSTEDARAGLGAVRPRDRSGQPDRRLPPVPHPRLAALFRALDEVGVAWCLLRGEEELAEPQGDVDLLVPRDVLARLNNVTARLEFAPVPAWGYGSHSFFVAYDVATDLWLKLDVVTELAFGPNYELATGAEAECLARRRRVGEIWLLAEDDAFWTLLLHRIIDKSGVDARDAARLTVLAEAARTDGRLARLADSLCPPDWSASRLVATAKERDWAALAGLGPVLAGSWRMRQRGDTRRRAVANMAHRWSGKAFRPSKRRGLRVALLAPDGAGKSTLGQALEHSFYFPVRVVPMGLYRGPRARTIRRARGIGLPGQLLSQWKGWLRGAYHRRRGRLVIFDRYAYDALLPTRFRYDRMGRARRWLLAHACPAPELVILLDAPGPVLYARKGEKSAELLERQRRAYRALLPDLPQAVIVDAAREAEDVRREVTSLIWQRFIRSRRMTWPRRSETRM
jgi:thymidylate kinase